MTNETSGTGPVAERERRIETPTGTVSVEQTGDGAWMRVCYPNLDDDGDEFWERERSMFGESIWLYGDLRRAVADALCPKTDTTTSGTGPGAEEREKYGRIIHDAGEAYWLPLRTTPSLPWDTCPEDAKEMYRQEADAVIAAYRDDHPDDATDPGARRDRALQEMAVTIVGYRGLVDEFIHPHDEANAETIGETEQHLGEAARDVIEGVPEGGHQSVLDWLAAPDRPAGTAGDAFAVGDTVRLRDGVLPSLTTRVGPIREVASARSEAIVDLGDGGLLWVQFSEIAGTGPEGVTT